MQVFRTLVEITKDINGAKVENHKFCVSVHYRNVEENVRISYPTHQVFICRIVIKKNSAICYDFLLVKMAAELDNYWTTCP